MTYIDKMRNHFSLALIKNRKHQTAHQYIMRLLI